MLEDFLICIFGAEQPPSYRDRTAESVCEGSTEVKVLHCMRQTASLSLDLMCICMCINSASKCRMKRVRTKSVRSAPALFSINMSAVQYICCLFL